VDERTDGRPPHARAEVASTATTELTTGPPRACGAEHLDLVDAGPPPHARGRVQDRRHRDGVARTTPARAGQWAGRFCGPLHHPDHPRARAVEPLWIPLFVRRSGPPRARGVERGRHVWTRQLGPPPHARGRAHDH